MSFFSNLSNRLRVSNKNMGNYFCEKTKHVMKLTLVVTKTKIRSIGLELKFHSKISRKDTNGHCLAFINC